MERADRIAQEVVKRYLEPILEPIFHDGSYGYRPGRSATDAVRKARQRCWRYNWVLDVDVRSYFDSIDWELLLRAVRQHTICPWVLLYIERWLKAPVQLEDRRQPPMAAAAAAAGSNGAETKPSASAAPTAGDRVSQAKMDVEKARALDAKGDMHVWTTSTGQGV